MEKTREELQKERDAEIEKLMKEGALKNMTECAYGKVIADTETDDDK